MSDNADPTRGCAGKKQYRSFAYAEVIAARSARRNDEPMHAYHCTRCNRFHVGTHNALKRQTPPAPRIEESEHDD